MKTTDNITVKVEISVIRSHGICDTTKLFSAVRENAGSMTLRDMRINVSSLTSDASEQVKSSINDAIEKEVQIEEARE